MAFKPSTVHGHFTTMFLWSEAQWRPSRTMPSASVATTSAEMGPSTVRQISTQDLLGLAALLGEQARVGGDAVEHAEGGRLADLLQACGVQEDLHDFTSSLRPRGSGARPRLPPPPRPRPRGGAARSPAGVPVEMISPGRSVITRETNQTRWSTSKMRSAVDPCWRTSPFTRPVTAKAAQVQARGHAGAHRAEGVEALGPRELDVLVLQLARGDVVDAGGAEDVGGRLLPASARSVALRPMTTPSSASWSTRPAQAGRRIVPPGAMTGARAASGRAAAPRGAGCRARPRGPCS